MRDLGRALLAVVAAGWAHFAVAAAELTLSVVPQFPALEIHRAWTPVAAALGKATGREVRLKIHASIPAFEEDFLAGTPDLVYLNPYHAVLAGRAQGYVPLVRDGARRLSGILVVHADSPVRSPTELAGKQVVFPAPNAFGASLLIRALLTDQFQVPFAASYVRTHGNAYRHVARGEAAAAGGIRATLEREPPELRAKLRVLYETPGYAGHPLAAHPRLPKQLRAVVAEAMLRLARSDEGRAILAAVQFEEPVPADYERDYRALERLGLERQVAAGRGQ